jgi:hypothetical protein
MKSLPAFKIIFFVICLLLITSNSIAAEKMTDRWHITGYTKYRDAVFVDISRLTFPTPGTVTIWVKIAPAGKSGYFRLVNEYLASVNKSDKGFKSIEILCEINCSGHLIRFSRFMYFDASGNVIHAVDETNPQRYLIEQGNPWYNVEKEACAEKK